MGAEQLSGIEKRLTKQEVKMKQLRTIICILLIQSMVCGAMGGCCFAESTAESAAALKDCKISHSTEYGGVFIKISIDDFNALGFQFGDSVDIVFSNGVRLEDQPYYSGYYTENGQSLLLGKQSDTYIRACINYGDDLWKIAGVNKDDTATITLRERAKYLENQHLRDIHYTDNRDDYATDEAFSNFRSVTTTGVAAGILYRSASPCNNKHNRASCTDSLVGSAGVRCILDLSDDEKKIKRFIGDESFNSPYFLSLYEEGHVIPLALKMNFAFDDFMQKLAAGLSDMADQEGPYLIHCIEGKDRTGFVCMLLEALCGASLQEVVEDYMITYDNYYGINPDSDPARYNGIVKQSFYPMILALSDDENTAPEDVDLYAGARRYLLKGGMEEQQIDRLIERLKNPGTAETEGEDSPKVAYLGPEGTYTEEAAQFWFRNGEKLSPEKTVNDAISAVQTGNAAYAVIPQENTLGGAVVNYVDALIAADDTYVVGEVVLPISQTLMGVPGSKLSDIRTVCSHAQGLTQSAGWREQNLPDAKTKEMESTAAAASYVAEQKDPSIAAVAAPGAAKLYGLDVLAQNVQITDSNKTRFYVLSEAPLEEDGLTNAVFVTTCEGSQIGDTITALQENGLEMVSIHDRPEGSSLGSYHYVIEAKDEGGISGDQVEAICSVDGTRFAGCFNAVEKAA